jgi:hypothetical protein
MIWLFMIQANWLNNIRGFLIFVGFRRLFPLLGSWLGCLSFDGWFGFLQLI